MQRSPFGESRNNAEAEPYVYDAAKVEQKATEEVRIFLEAVAAHAPRMSVFHRVAKVNRIKRYYRCLDGWLQRQSGAIPNNWALDRHAIKRDVANAGYLPDQLLGAVVGHPDPSVAMCAAEHHQLSSELLGQVQRSDLPPDVVRQIMTLQEQRFGGVRPEQCTWNE